MKHLFSIVFLLLVFIGTSSAQSDIKGNSAKSSKSESKVTQKQDKEQKLFVEPSFSFSSDSDEVWADNDCMPTFRGNLMKFIADNLQYPVICSESAIQGRVIVKFLISADGSCSNFQVVRSVDPSLDREAIRVLKLMPKWQWRDGCKGRRVWYTVPVTFHLQ